MSNVYDLEQQILQTWGIIDDLRVLLEVVDGDKAQNILIGTIELYQIRFQQLFDTYERVIAKQSAI